MLIQELIEKVYQKFNIEVSEEDINNIIQIQTEAFKEGLIRKIPIHITGIGKWVYTDSLKTRIEIRRLKTTLNELKDDYSQDVLDKVFKDKLKEKALNVIDAKKKSILTSKFNYKTLDEILQMDKARTANNIIKKL